MSALKSEKVNHILSDIAVLNRILANIVTPEDYLILVKNPYIASGLYL